MSLPPINTLTTEAGRSISGRQNVSRFEAVGASFITPIIDMPLTSTDHLVQPGPVPTRNVYVQMKDIEFGVYLPDCTTDPQVPPPQNRTPINGIYHTYTFYLYTNDNQWQFAMVFNKNIDRVRSPLWMSVFPTVLNQPLSMKVRRDSIDPTWADVPVSLFCLVEFFVYTQ